MPFKINISDKGKTFHLETETESVIGRKINEFIKGEDIMPELEGYELEIKGLSDKAGFPAKADIEGTALKKVLLKKGFNLKSKPKKEGKKRLGRKMPQGLRMRKRVRGNTISPDIIQINTIVKKSGTKKLEQIFPNQGKSKQSSEVKQGEQPGEQKTTEQIQEKPEEKQEEQKPEVKTEEKKAE